MSDDALTIGQLAARTGLRTSALRYYEERDLVRPAHRESGQRRYEPSTVDLVGVILLLQEVGFTLREIRRFVHSPSSAPLWRHLATRKLEELDEQIATAQAARTAIEHSLACPQESVLDCPNFWATVDAILDRRPLADAHPH